MCEYEQSFPVLLVISFLTLEAGILRYLFQHSYFIPTNISPFPSPITTVYSILENLVFQDSAHVCACLLVMPVFERDKVLLLELYRSKIHKKDTGLVLLFCIMRGSGEGRLCNVVCGIICLWSATSIQPESMQNLASNYGALLERKMYSYATKRS